jgi:Mrp family chromosome partitioning ATPase/capsular polysaccharide biosynthesis protein
MAVLRRHGVWVVVAALAGIAGAWLFYAARPHVYLSTAQVDVEANATLGTPVPPNMATETQIATSGIILGRTAAALGVSAQSLAGQLSAKVSSTATVLSIGCTRADAKAAQRCAQAVASAYVGFRNLLSAPAAQQARDPVRATLVTPATLPASPAGPGRKIVLPIGGVLGLALGIGAIILRDRFDDRVRDRADMERCLGAPVLAAIPRTGRAVDPAFVFSRAPRSTAAEAYRYLRSNVRPFLAAGHGGGTVLLVAGPQGREGRTCVAANLARSLAQAGACVIAVDADLRHTWRSGFLHAHPSLSEIFQADDRPGLNELLTGKASLDEVALPVEMAAETRTPPAAGLRFVAAGEPAGRSADIFDGVRLTAALAGMRAAADVVVVDSAPVLAVSDAMSLARASDVVLMVADVRRTGRGALGAAAREIRVSGPHQVVGVLNGQPFSRRWPRSSAEPERDWPVPRRGDLPVPGGMVAITATNGQKPVQIGAASPRPHGGAHPRGGFDDPTEPGLGSR